MTNTANSGLVFVSTNSKQYMSMKKIRIIIIILITVSVLTALNAQTNKIDSFKNLLLQHTSNTMSFFQESNKKILQNNKKYRDIKK